MFPKIFTKYREVGGDLHYSVGNALFAYDGVLRQHGFTVCLKDFPEEGECGAVDREIISLSSGQACGVANFTWRLVGKHSNGLPLWQVLSYITFSGDAKNA
ncbi:MAG: hypothetical protein MKZ95_11640 [Pirellulales bacterium]|nr:hypothetical protein [Pirellulales bacterium]